MALSRGPAPARRDPGKQRVLGMTVGVLAAFLVVIGQLWYLQVLEGARLQELSDKNRIRIRPVAAPRGVLFDRNGLPLVDNRPAFTLSLIPREIDDRARVLGRVSVLLKIPYAELDDALGRVPGDPLMPVRVRRGLTLEEVAKVEEWKLELPGVIVEVEPQRMYPTSRFAAHLLGYVREANEEQLRQGRYRRGDMVGQSGLERLLDQYLRGTDGGERIEVDALGRPIRLIQHTEPVPGAQVVTTIDRRIQEAAERAMQGHAGAVVVLDPRDGDVLAMVSTPAFALDQFTGTIDRDAWVQLIRNPAHPMLNRTVQSQYAPGSVFKIVVAAAGLQETTLTPMDHVFCTGEFHLGNRTFGDWKEGGHGTVDLHHAIVESCNVYFYEAALRIGMDTIALALEDRAVADVGPGQGEGFAGAEAGVGERLRLRDVHGHRPAGGEAGLHPGLTAGAAPDVPRRHGEHGDRPGRRPGDADAGRAHDGRRRQRWNLLQAPPRAAGRARRRPRAV